MKINYQVKGEGVSLILLHGWGGSISSLAPLQDQLSDLGFQVFNLDLPGFGQSTMSKEEMTISDYVEFLANYINRLNIYKPVIVGHSFGGQVAMAFAIKNPLVASRLVLINASGLNPRNGMKKTSMLIVAKIFGAVLSIPPFSIIKGISRKLFYKFIVRESDYAKAGNMKSTMKNILAKNLDQEIEKIEEDTLIIWGEKDSQTPLWMGKLLSEKIKNSRLEIIENATHGLPIKQPELVANLIYTYIKA